MTGILDTLYSYSGPGGDREEPKAWSFPLYRYCHFLQVGLLYEGKRFFADVFIVDREAFFPALVLLTSSASIVDALYAHALDW